MKNIQKLRNDIAENNDSPYFGGMEETAELLHDLLNNDQAESVHSRTEDRGGRWTKWEIKVVKVIENDETAYFQIEQEVGSTEVQSDGDVVVREVTPKEVSIVQYVPVDAKR